MPYQFILLSSFDPTGLATIDYVDAQDNTKIGKSGFQTLETGEWRLKQPRSGGGTASFVVINDNVMNLYHVAYPQNGEHAANAQYVDDQIAAIPEPDLSGYATEQYVDDQDATKLNLTGGTLTGVLKMQRTDDVSWWNYIRSEKPMHGMVKTPASNRFTVGHRHWHNQYLQTAVQNHWPQQQKPLDSVRRWRGPC